MKPMIDEDQWRDRIDVKLVPKPWPEEEEFQGKIEYLEAQTLFYDQLLQWLKAYIIYYG